MRRAAGPLLLILVITGVFFGRGMAGGRMPFPGDILTGMYYPWLSQKWGYEVGVPVKNPMLSDPVAQDFGWKAIAAEAFRRGGLPLWNPYSYSGYPLLANFQSGALYPFDLLMTFLGNARGWNWLMIWGVAGSAIGMYLLLSKLKLSPAARAAGAVTYAFSAYAMSWMEFATGAQVMVWVPFLFIGTELVRERRMKLAALLIPAATYMLFTAGQAQIGMYGLLAATGYAICRLGLVRGTEYLILTGVGGVMAAIQILPTLELTRLSVRGAESYISSQRWGLIPPVQLITGIAADFFGNPATGNHWGWWQYHETVFYAGVAAAIAMAGALLEYKKLGRFRYFLGLALAGLALGIDWPVGRLPYVLKLPIWGTGSAGRVFLWYVTGAAVLTGWWTDRLAKTGRKKAFKSVGYPLLILGMTAATAAGAWMMMPGDASPLPETRAKLMISLRNSAIPLGLLIITGMALAVRKNKNFGWIMLAIITADLLRAGWKYVPFSPSEMLYPKEEVTEWLSEHTAGEPMRIARERGELMPPNTWMMYGLSSPSGYDPLAPAEYTDRYEKVLNKNANVTPGRYAELTWFDAGALGKYNVKYLLAIKRDEKDRIPGDKISYKIDESRWKRVMETENVAILENTKYQPRAGIEEGNIQIKEYQPGKVKLDYDQASPGTGIVVADAYYPGWEACEEGSCRPVSESGDGFVKTKTAGSAGRIDLVYRPDSFRNGMGITMLGLILWAGAVLYYRNYGTTT